MSFPDLIRRPCRCNQGQPGRRRAVKWEECPAAAEPGCWPATSAPVQAHKCQHVLRKTFREKCQTGSGQFPQNEVFLIPPVIQQSSVWSPVKPLLAAGKSKQFLWHLPRWVKRADGAELIRGVFFLFVFLKKKKKTGVLPPSLCGGKKTHSRNNDTIISATTMWLCNSLSNPFTRRSDFWCLIKHKSVIFIVKSK